jgi:alpha-beta hydrolase superfamily lysophospholipase
MTTRSITTIRISTDDAPVWADLYDPAEAPGGDGTPARTHESPRGVVVLCHGLKGYRHWGFIPRLGENLRSAGLHALAIDFSHNGVAGGDAGASGGPVYAYPEMVRRNTLDRERRDLEAVIRWIRAGAGGRFPDGTPLGLWGHSRGGGSVLLNAIDDPTGIAAISTWSTPAHADIYSPKQKARWREAGEFDFLRGTNGENLAMGVCHLDDLEARRDEYAFAGRLGELTVPYLIVHGEADPVIPVRNADELYRAANGLAEKRLVRLRTGHTFGVVGPAENQTALNEAVAVTVDWFGNYLPVPGVDE